MKTTHFVLIEHRPVQEKEESEAFLQRAVTAWLTKELNHSTNDACTEASVQAL